MLFPVTRRNNASVRFKDVDFHAVEEHQRAIHARLENWGRWCNGSTGSSTNPMFRMSVGSARSRGDYGAATANPVDGADAVSIARVVATLPDPHRHALQWCYVKPVNPKSAAQAIGTNAAGLYQYLRDGRQMLINKKA